MDRCLNIESRILDSMTEWDLSITCTLLPLYLCSFPLSLLLISVYALCSHIIINVSLEINNWIKDIALCLDFWVSDLILLDVSETKQPKSKAYQVFFHTNIWLVELSVSLSNPEWSSQTGPPPYWPAASQPTSVPLTVIFQTRYVFKTETLVVCLIRIYYVKTKTKIDIGRHFLTTVR